LAAGHRDLALADYRSVLALSATTDADRRGHVAAKAAVEKLLQPKAANPDPDPTLNETVVNVPLTIKLPNGSDYEGQFVLTVFKPNGPGPFPAVIVSHGHAGQFRGETGRNRDMWEYWLQRGFAVLAPTRIGHGVSFIPADPEAAGGSCETSDFGPGSAAGVAHILATTAYGRKQSWIERDQIVLAGSSAGGLYSLLAGGSRPQGVKLIVNFAGGGRSLPNEQPCNPKNVGALLQTAGQSNPIPTIWFYAENDKNWGALVPRGWHTAYANAGGHAEFHMLPPLGEDGHKTIMGLGKPYWLPVLDRMLIANGFNPRKIPSDAPQPSGFAAVDDISKVPLIDDKGRAGYQAFLTKPVLRVFAIGPDGFWAYSAGKFKSLSDALIRCSQGGKRTCKPYAINDQVVWQP
jgi:dienelactone hydrolase